MSNEVGLLRVEVAELKEEVESLKAELVRLRRTIAEIKAGGLSLRSIPDDVSEDSYSVVSERSDSRAPSGYTRSDSRAVVDRNINRSPTPASSSSIISWEERVHIAEEVGRWLHRAISGLHRGKSSRSRNPLGSHVWIVVRDYAGQIYTPVKVHRNWTSCCRLVRPGGVEPGCSVFIGLPTEEEAKIAVEAGGLVWPAVIEQ